MSADSTEPDDPAQAGLRPGPRGARREVIPPSTGRVSWEPAAGGRPATASPTSADIDLAAWAADHRAEVEDRLHSGGAVLFRGFGVAGPAQFEQTMTALYPTLTAETERSSPRHQVEGNVFTSTDHPADQPIFLHNEMSYSRTWPMRLGFCCLQAPAEGGATPLADMRAVTRAIPSAVRDAFDRRGVLYVRNFGDGLGLSWKESFGTEDPHEVERYCAQHGIDVEWKSGQRLRTRRVGPATATHPVTGEVLWFNHATFFNVATLQPDLRDALVGDMAAEELPTNTFYGDGGRIEDQVLEQLRDAFDAATTSFPWQEGDVLVIDNMLCAHGRAPYRGDRKIVVAMAEPISRSGGGAG